MRIDIYSNGEVLGAILGLAFVLEILVLVGLAVANW